MIFFLNIFNYVKYFFQTKKKDLNRNLINLTSIIHTAILEEADLSKITTKTVRLSLEKKFDTNLLSRKKEIDAIVMDFVNKKNGPASDDDSEEEEEKPAPKRKQSSDDDSASDDEPPKKTRKSKTASSRGRKKKGGSDSDNGKKSAKPKKVIL